MTTPQSDFMAWWTQHYDVDAAGKTSVCKRCGQSVGYVTKHAVERHGDPIEVMPPTPETLHDRPEIVASY